MLPRQVSILVFEIQSLAGCRLPHGGSWLPGQFATAWGKQHAEGFLTYGSVGYGSVGTPSSTRGINEMTPPAVAAPEAPTRAQQADDIDVDTGTLGGEQKRPWEQVALALFIGIPFLAVLAAVPIAWGGFLGWRDIVLAVVFYTIAGHGISIGFHRLFTHKSFKPNR